MDLFTKKQEFINHLKWKRTWIQSVRFKWGSVIIRKGHIKQNPFKRDQISWYSGNKKFDMHSLLKKF